MPAMPAAPAASAKPAASARPAVLHYVGYDTDAGGIVSIVRNLAGAAAARFDCVLGVNPGFAQLRAPPLPVLELPRVEGERISPSAFWRARIAARAAQSWLRADGRNIFHGHSRAGLLVALWLARWGERRAVASVHCYGRRRWFYRWAARSLGGRLWMLSPAMLRYYGIGAAAGWEKCLPGCVRFPVAGGHGGERRGAPRDGVLPAGGGLLAEARPADGTGVLRAGGIGALARWKGWHLALEALARLPAEARGRWRFTHIGGEDGSAESARYAAELRAQTRALGLETCVRWAGPRPSSEALLRGLDVLLVPSDNEPFSVARLEALAAGVPSLSADSGGARDLVVPPENGWLFRSGDAEDMARHLARLAAPGALAEARIDRAALARRFSVEASVARHAEIYEVLLSGGGNE
ncbi:MAG: glycosyltransferase [Opitutaceae bacterium]|jgi:glycosyltransferase involved in cell wall biosynthesis|nr:glycosyltransferase [Opitutaceae bacterium]